VEYACYHYRQQQKTILQFGNLDAANTNDLATYAGAAVKWHQRNPLPLIFQMSGLRTYIFFPG